MDNRIPTLGYASGIGAPHNGSAEGPFILKNTPVITPGYFNPQILDWKAILTAPEEIRDKYTIIASLNAELARLTYQLVQKREQFLVVGGDHTSAIGTWSGAAEALIKQGPIGLIWIDAHMDSHTPQTTESGNIHGMPLACLLGYGDPRLAKITASSKLSPENVCLIGIRSYESGEAELLENLGVRIFFMQEIQQRGFDSIWKEALSLVTAHTIGYGISVDIDSIDPIDAPGVTTPAPEGLIAEELLEILPTVTNTPTFLGLEIAEFNPQFDLHYQTLNLIQAIITATFFGRYSYEPAHRT